MLDASVREAPKAPKKRGFALLLEKDPALMRKISRKGAKAAWKAGKAHKFTKAQAREAGRKGGLAKARKQKEETNGKQVG